MHTKTYLEKASSIAFLRLVSVLSMLLFIYIWAGDGVSTISNYYLYWYTGSVLLVAGLLVFGVALRTYSKLSLDLSGTEISSKTERVTHTRSIELPISIGISICLALVVMLFVTPPTGYTLPAAIITLVLVSVSRSMSNSDRLPSYYTHFVPRIMRTVYPTDMYEKKQNEDLNTISDKTRSRLQDINQLVRYFDFLTLIAVLGLLLLSLFQILLNPISASTYTTIALITVGLLTIKATTNLIPAVSQNETEIEKQKLLIQMVLRSVYGGLFFGSFWYLYLQGSLTITPIVVILLWLFRVVGTVSLVIKSKEYTEHTSSTPDS